MRHRLVNLAYAPAMNRFDVFNGDADGICALHQLRLDTPAAAVLVTGVKRDIALLGKVPAKAGDSVTVLDVSAAANHDALVSLLDRGVSVQYFDHHNAGDLPAHAALSALIDTAPQACTGVLVDRYLNGRQRRWAIVAAYGDNLRATAAALGGTLGLDAEALEPLRLLGEALNYNAYGDTEADLLVHPAKLYRMIQPYADPYAFLRAEDVFARIDAARREDVDLALAVKPALVTEHASALVLPDAAWSRRVRGALGNELANAEPARAHAVLTFDRNGNFTGSIRAPLLRPIGADVLCRRFDGDGRPAAAGINDLPPARLDEFLRVFSLAFGATDAVTTPPREPARVPD